MIGLIRQQGDDGDPESPVKHYPGHGSPVKTVLSKLQRANTKGGKNQKSFKVFKISCELEL